MKTIYAFVVMGVDVTDDEYEVVRNEAYDPRNLDNPYNDIAVPEWLMKKIKSDGKIKGDGNIPSSIWR